MKCYVGGSSNPQEYGHVAVCFANNAKEAKKLMWRGRLSDECDGDWLDARVIRQPANDHFLDAGKEQPYCISEHKTLRLMGWSMEGEQRCDCCGQAAMDIDEFQVCAMCGQCPECASEDCEDCECREGDQKNNEN